MAQCLACRGPANAVGFAIAPNPSGGEFVEEVFSCSNCRTRGVIQAALPAGHAWSKVSPSLVPASCSQCQRTVHPERLLHCPACGTAGCGSCMGIEPAYGVCGECLARERALAFQEALHLEPGIPEHTSLVNRRQGERLGALASQYGTT